MWDQVDFNYMSEETDGEDVVHKHKLTWRSRSKLYLSNYLYDAVVYRIEPTCSKA